MNRLSSIKFLLLNFVSLLALALPGSLAQASDGGLEVQAERLLHPKLSLSQRLAAAKALGASEDPVALDALVRVLDQSGESLRDTVIEILQKGKGAEVLAKRALDESLSVEERVLAVKGLRVMRNPIGFPALKQLLSSPVVELRKESALALAMAGAATAEPELTRTLNDPDKDVRYYAADALGTVKSPSAKASLENREKVETDPAVLNALKQGTR